MRPDISQALNDVDVYLFDWDGTLGRSLEVWLRVLRRVARDFDLQLTDAELADAAFGKSFTEIAEALGLADRLDDMRSQVKRQAMRMVRDVDLYPGAREMLNDLRSRGNKLALISSSFRQSLERAVAHNQLDGVFDVVISGDDVSSLKPDPEGITLVLERLSATPDRAVMVGDSVYDIRAAENAGIASVLFYPPSHQLFYNREELVALSPTIVVDDLRELCRAKRN
ncbi:hypothetical protein CR970_04115 [Candidatus Saccharibacteria bacterium]|nr:MAG: hypothetical protein CR970_04115 [Candidatus Saccharibacteria bacterium]